MFKHTVVSFHTPSLSAVHTKLCRTVTVKVLRWGIQGGRGGRGWEEERGVGEETPSQARKAEAGRKGRNMRVRIGGG